MNNVTLVGKVVKLWDCTTVGSVHHACAQVSIPRPYKVKGKYKFDIFTLHAWGLQGDRLLMAKPGQVIGVNGILEVDDEKKAYVNIRTTYFYSNKAASEIGERFPCDEEVAALSGFESISPTDIPDF